MYVSQWAHFAVALGIALIMLRLFFRDDCGIDLGFVKEFFLLLFVAAVQTLVLVVVLRVIGANNEHSRRAATIIGGLLTALIYKVFHLNSLDPAQITTLSLFDVIALFLLPLIWR